MLGPHVSSTCTSTPKSSPLSSQTRPPGPTPLSLPHLSYQVCALKPSAKKEGNRDGEDISPLAPVSPSARQIQGRPGETHSAGSSPQAGSMASARTTSGVQGSQSFWDTLLDRGTEGGNCCPPEGRVWTLISGGHASSFSPSALVQTRAPIVKSSSDMGTLGNTSWVLENMFQVYLPVL